MSLWRAWEGLKNNAAILGRALFAIVLCSALLLLAPPAANAGLTEFFSATGKLSLSVDGAGPGIAQVAKPNSSATVRKAYVMAASPCGANAIPNGGVSINGNAITWDESIVNAFFFSVRADVTSIVKPVVDAAPAGRINFTFTHSGCVDGEVLVVVFDDPVQTSDTTIILLFGGQALTGDTFAITLAEPIDPSSAGALADMGLGISFGFQPSGQFSIVDVNGQRLSTSAGGQDDGGGLITVGGLDDSNANPPNPTATDGTCGPPAAPRCDDELYSLLPFITANDTSISVFTRNPSNDDNIFFAYFNLSGAAIVGEGIVLSPTTASNPVGTQHTVTAKVTDDNGFPVQDTLVTFTVTSGPNAGENGTDTTDANGEATFTYTGDGGAGTDQIEASFVDSQENTKTSNTVTKEWTQSDCEGAEGPCLIAGGAANEDYLVGDPPQLSPGIKVNVSVSNVTTIKITKTAQVFADTCRERLGSSRKITWTQEIDALTGEVLTTQEVSALKATARKLKRMSKARRQAFLAAAVNGAASFDVKISSLGLETLEAAREHGCEAVRLVASFTMVGLDELRNEKVRLPKVEVTRRFSPP